MLDTPPAKATGPSETHGLHHGENKDISESSLDLTSVIVRNMPGTQKFNLYFKDCLKLYYGQIKVIFYFHLSFYSMFFSFASEHKLSIITFKCILQ